MNPILRREFVGLLRTRKAVAVQVALAVAVAALVVIRWPAEGVGDLSGATALQVLRVFAYGLLTGLLLVVPAFPATTIVRESARVSPGAGHPVKMPLDTGEGLPFGGARRPSEAENPLRSVYPHAEPAL